MKYNFVVGDTVFFEQYGFIYEAVIDDINNGIVKLNWKQGGTSHKKIGDIYSTYNDCFEALKCKLDKIKNGYRSQIKSVKDLVVFMYNHCVARAEEYTDWEAREVVAEKAKELLEIEL